MCGIQQREIVSEQVEHAAALQEASCRRVPVGVKLKDCHFFQVQLVALPRLAEVEICTAGWGGG